MTYDGALFRAQAEEDPRWINSFLVLSCIYDADASGNLLVPCFSCSETSAGDE